MMRIRLKKKGSFKSKRMESVSKIDDIMAKGDLLGDTGKINVYFRGEDSSGILDFSREEAEKLVNSIKSVLNLLGKGRFI